jgi:integrase
MLTLATVAERLHCDGRDRERSVRRLFERHGVCMIRRGRRAYFVTEGQYAELIEKMTVCSQSGGEAKNSMSAVRSVTRVIKEHSCGTDRRDVAEAYRSRLENDLRHEILHGSRGRTHTLTVADAAIRYIGRPGGVRSYDIWRLGQINDVIGDRPIAQAAAAWTEFKRIRCSGLSPATVQRFKATFSAAVNYLATEEGFDAPKLPRGEKVSSKRTRYLTPEQADRLIKAYASHVQPIAIVLCWQGVRIGEALRCDWLHLNWKADSIFIPDSKNGEPRTVTLHPKTRTALHRLWVTRGSPTEGPMFLTNRGAPYRDPRGYKIPSGSPIKKAHATACRHRRFSRT